MSHSRQKANPWTLTQQSVKSSPPWVQIAVTTDLEETMLVECGYEMKEQNHSQRLLPLPTTYFSEIDFLHIHQPKLYAAREASPWKLLIHFLSLRFGLFWSECRGRPKNPAVAVQSRP